MQHAIRPGNPNQFDVDSYFKDYDEVYWRQGHFNQEVGDIIYIYVSGAIQRIKYKTVVEEIDLPFHETNDDKEYWPDLKKYDKSKSQCFMKLRLIAQGDTEELSSKNLIDKKFLKVAPQGKKIMYDDKKPHKYDYEFVQYVDTFLTDVPLDETDDCFGDQLKEADVHKFPEGAVKKVKVNTYERSKDARRKCIEHHGVKCSICGLSFEEMYGELGKGYIHVHHIVPLSEIGEGYEVDPINDLIPVCPNCHNMLHKKINGKFLSIDELKEIVESHRN